MKRTSKSLHIDTKSIRFVSWLAFLLFGLVIILFLWLTQVVFLQVYVNNTKGRDFANIAQELRQAHMGEYEREFDRIANKESVAVDILMIDPSGKATVEYSSSGFRFGDRDDNAFSLSGVTQEIAQNATRSSGVYRRDDENKQLTYGIYLNGDGNKLLVISQSSELLDSTAKILMIQMVIASAIIIILSFCVSFLLSSAFSQDLRLLSSTARKLSQDDYNVQFVEKGFTEARELAAALNYATAEMQKTEALRRELLSNVSHDLRTPLTIIRGYAEMVRDLTGEDKEKRDQQLNVIIDETDRLSALVGDLLQLSRMQNQAGEMNITTIDLAETTRRALGSFELLEIRDGYHFEVETDQNVLVQGDQKQLQTVIYNLVSNAVNYTGDDKVVKIAVTKQDGMVRFAVTDTGDGLDEEQLAHIWQRYYRASEHKRSVVGTGLGLSIVQSALERHHALYGVDSKKGQGSTFWFALPLVGDSTASA